MVLACLALPASALAEATVTTGTRERRQPDAGDAQRDGRSRWPADRLPVRVRDDDRLRVDDRHRLPARHRGLDTGRSRRDRAGAGHPVPLPPSRAAARDRRRHRRRPDVHDGRRAVDLDRRRRRSTEGDAGDDRCDLHGLALRGVRPDRDRRLRDGRRHADAAGGLPAGERDADFAPGETSKTITVRSRATRSTRTTRRYTVGLSSPANATIADATGAGTITDDDPPVSIQIDDIGVTEGDSGTATATFTVTSPPRAARRSRRLRDRRRHGATQPADYAADDGHADLHARARRARRSTCPSPATRSTSRTRRSPSTSRTPSGVTLLDGHGVATITDDDAAADDLDRRRDAGRGQRGHRERRPSPSASARRAARRSPSTTRPPTARPPQPADYTQTSGTLTFTAGPDDQDDPVAVNGDTLDEADEGFTVGLSEPDQRDDRRRHGRRHDHRRRRPAADLDRRRHGDRGQRRQRRPRASPSRSRAASGEDGHRRLRDRRRRGHAARRLHADQRHADVRARARPPRTSSSRSRATRSTRTTRRFTVGLSNPTNATLCGRQRRRDDHRRRRAAQPLDRQRDRRRGRRRDRRRELQRHAQRGERQDGHRRLRDGRRHRLRSPPTTRRRPAR